MTLSWELPYNARDGVISTEIDDDGAIRLQQLGYFFNPPIFAESQIQNRRVFDICSRGFEAKSRTLYIGDDGAQVHVFELSKIDSDEINCQERWTDVFEAVLSSAIPRLDLHECSEIFPTDEIKSFRGPMRSWPALCALEQGHYSQSMLCRQPQNI